MRIKTEIPGYEETTLDKLWSKYEGGTFTEGNKVRAEEVFRSAVMRVPMDSISGAQVLKFSGFTVPVLSFGHIPLSAPANPPEFQPTREIRNINKWSR